MASMGKMKTITLFLFVSLMSGVSSINIVNITGRRGQNISLPCDLNSESANVVQMQWHRELRENRQEEIVVVYNPTYGEGKPNKNKGQLGALKNSSVSGLRRFYLDLENLQPEDSGLYVCDIITFPYGTIRHYVNLKVKDEEDRDTTARPETTDEPVNLTSSPRPHRSTIQFASTSSSSAVINMAISTSANTDGMSALSHSSTEESNTISISYTNIQSELNATTWSLVSQNSNATVTDFMPRTDSEQSTMHDIITKTESLAWTGPENSTKQRVGSGTLRNPHETTTIVTSPDQQSHGNTTMSDLSPKVTTNSGGLLPALIILFILGLVVVLGCLYRRYLIKKRMDLPPPFKPPPPPVKYTSVRTQNDILMTDILMTDVLV